MTKEQETHGAFRYGAVVATFVGVCALCVSGYTAYVQQPNRRHRRRRINMAQRVMMAQVYALFGDTDLAFEAIQKVIGIPTPRVKFAESYPFHRGIVFSPHRLGNLQVELQEARKVRLDIDEHVTTIKASLLDALNQMTTIAGMKLQSVMERYSKSLQMLSNVLKKISETTSGIVQNLK